MSKFTKVSLMLLVFLVSGAGVFAQQYELSNEQERIAAEQMLEKEHGPTVVVPPSQGSRATGDDCSDPIVVTLPNDLPYSDVNYTCGRGNTYDATCMGSYDGGEDIIYQIVVTSQIELEFTFDPQGTTWTGIALMDDCPDVGTCIDYVTGSSGTTPKVITEVLDPGTYYFMADTWPSPACIPTFSLSIAEVIPPPPLDPIAAFPYMEDFEAGDFPSTMQAVEAPQSHIVVSADAAYNSSYGSLFDGFGATGWSGGSTSTTYDQAFNTNTDHIASINMLVEPDGTAGQLLMEFDLKGNYSFGANYSWFRVLVDGVAIDDMEGNPYFMADATNSEGEFDHLVYDLSAYQGLSSFTLTLQSSCKYDYLDYRDGDYWMLDNFDLYFLQLGDVEGYTFNGDGLIVNGANVWVTEDNATVSGVDGYYILTDVAYGPQDLMGWKEGYNVVTYPINIGSTTAYQDIVLTQPEMIINPLQLNETLNPNEFLTTYLGILNSGDGPLHWNAEITYNDNFQVNEPTGESPITGFADNAGNSPLTDKPKESVTNPDGPRDLWACNEGSLFANEPAGADNGYWSQNGGTYQAYQQITGLSGSWTTITWWGLYLSGTPTTEDFFIGIYEDGAQPGAELASYIVECTPVNSGQTVVGYPAWQYTATIETQSYTDFFLSIQNTGSTQMYWCNSPTGTGIAGTGPSWSPVDPLAVCLEGGAAGGWLSLGQYEGDVNGNGGSFNLPVHFDATGFEAGDYVTADITFTSTPDVGTTVIPVSMTVIGDPLTPPENLEVELVDDVNGYVDLDWEWNGDLAFQYFRVERDGIYVASTTSNSYTDQLPDYGEYCYTVKAVYDEGMSAPAGPECVMWANPGLFIDPDELVGEVWVDHQVTVFTTIENTGIGTLTYVFPDYDNTDAFSCQHEIVMTDDFGDGWNGGLLDVFVDGVQVLNDLTINSGSGPEYAYFTAESGATITTTFTCGSWCYENAYEIYDGEGNLIASDGQGGSNPTGVTTTAFCPQPSFIVDVNPSSGFLNEGQTQEIAITYDATDFAPGTYYEMLYIESNDPDHLTDSIHNTMIVTQPAMYAGSVTDANTGAPISGVMVSAETFNTVTDDNGAYELYVNEGTYDVNFDKVGYQSIVVEDTSAMAGMITPIDVEMYEALYMPGWVTATVNDTDTECLVEWTTPWGAYEVLYDDGSADDFLVYSVTGNAHAVKFTPAGYPATIMGGSVFVGDGSFPVGSDFLGSTFGMAVIDDDGTDGMPGTVLDSIEVEVDNYGWIDFADLNATITDGDFYLAMFQGSTPPNAAPIGIDQSMPTVYRSYTYIGGLTNMWSLSAYQDFMIRAIVAGPQAGADVVMSSETVYPPKAVYYDKYIATGKPSGLPGTVKSGEMKAAPGFNVESLRENTGYKVARFSDFDPDFTPLDGDTSVLQNNTSTLSYNDAAFGGLPEGWYAYGVAARYDQGGNVWSDYAVSNIVGHLKEVAVTVNVTTTDGSIADSVEIILTGNTYPYEVYTHLTDETATVTFDPVWKGYYDLWVYKPGYEEVLFTNTWINADKTYDVVLGEKKYAPYNLYVDPLTSIATWNEPRITALKEDFEAEMFPPDGWTMTTEGEGWYRSDDASSDSWTIPAWDSYYAVANDDGAGSDNDGCCDYLITPALDLREASGYSLKFDQFFDGAYGQMAIVEASTDGGATWEVVNNMAPTAGSWTREEVDLADYSHDWDIPQVWIAFHADDGGEWASGWAIDNVEVSVGSDGDWPPMGYHVFLDDAFVAEVQEETYTYLNLQYGVEYTASVGALYTSGLSEKDYYTFTSEWLYPAENLAGVSYDNAVHLIWDPPCAPWFDVLSTEVRSEMPNPNTEYSPVVREIQNNYPGSRDLWDTQFEFPCGDASGEAGVESDGNYIYTTKWNAGNGTFFRYGLDGTFMGSFVVSGGPADIRDLAYDGDYFYGSNAGSTVWGMDFDDEVLVETISAPVSVRAIAYDDGFDGFWANNWSDAITLFDRDGVTLDSFSPGSYASYYGFAYDDQLSGGPYLYGFSQDASGAVIVEMEIATGTETGVTYDAIGFSTTGTGLAGGLAITDGIVPQKRTLLGIVQNETIFGLEFGDGGGVPTQCSTPDNVIGFNVYRDGAFQEYVEYFGEDQISWWQYDLQPDCYDYEVTAVYDLSPYGQFGEEGESMIEGPVNVCVSYGFPLPFMEDWEAGTFENKDWEVQCDNWDISTVIGNDGNSATFQWDPIQENYDCGIITYPLLGNDVVDGDIYLDFDLKIDDRFDTVTTELLTIRVWAGGEWTDITSFAAEGDKDWESHHINISTPAKGNDFRVGFFANGESSLNIDGWYIDNVHVYQLCAEPFDLSSEKVFETQDMGVVELNWVSPGATVQEWISYNDGTFENAIASTEGGAGLAQMFTPEDYPVTISEVRYFNSSFEQYMQECEIWILAGDGETVLGGPYYVEDGPADDWVNVDIDDITLNSGTFMVATFNVMAGGPYVGMDDSFYDGSLYFGAVGDFTEMGEFGYFYVGSHEALVEYEMGDNVVVNSVLTAPQASNNNQIANVSLSGTSAVAPAPASRELTGYNIWRNDELIETNWPDVTYSDTVYEANQYCYYISAVYDQCESDTLGVVCEDFVSGLGEETSGILEIYPNPTKDDVTIESPVAIERITVLNYVGQVVYDATVVEETTVKLDVSAYESGVYFIKVETEDGLTTERVTVAK